MLQPEVPYSFVPMLILEQIEFATVVPLSQWAPMAPPPYTLPESQSVTMHLTPIFFIFLKTSFGS